MLFASCEYLLVMCGVLKWPLFAVLQAVAAKMQPKQKVAKNVPKSAPRVGTKRWSSNH